jgi:hypothetical protein
MERAVKHQEHDPKRSRFTSIEVVIGVALGDTQVRLDACPKFAGSA